jgi:hypothetical protein
MCPDLRDFFREVVVTVAEIFVVMLTLAFFGSAFALAVHSRWQASRAEVPSASEEPELSRGVKDASSGPHPTLIS